jgi:hypothetical protein
MPRRKVTEEESALEEVVETVLEEEEVVELEEEEEEIPLTDEDLAEYVASLLEEKAGSYGASVAAHVRKILL